jgi:hypothetical protein
VVGDIFFTRQFYHRKNALLNNGFKRKIIHAQPTRTPANSG